MLSNLEYAKVKFRFLDNGEPDIDSYGEYVNGLSHLEIDEYLMVRANTEDITLLRKKFFDIVGINTCGVHICPCCVKAITLMYRHDVLRFADILFKKTKGTYFD